MIDKTTAGITAEPEEVEAVLNNLCGYHLAEPDAVFRYTVLTREQVLYDALVATIKRERGRALAELVASGRTLTEVAHLTNLGNRQRVQRLIAVARAAETAAAQVRSASREFDERMAAVEATLDEVVSGMRPPIPTARVPMDDAVDGVDQPTAVAVPAEDPSTVEASGTSPEQHRSEPHRSEQHRSEPHRSEQPVSEQHRSEAQASEPQASESHGSEPRHARSSRAQARDVAPPGSGLIWPGEVDLWEDPVDENDGHAAMREPTQRLPALAASLPPPRDLPATDDDTPWWRRGRDTGAA
jgi:hypothetical protein